MVTSVDAAGIRMAVTDEGSGVPVLLVHGFPLSAGMWSKQVSVLQRTHRILAPDLRGFGGTEVTDGEVTMEQFADDLAALLDAMGVEEPIVLCGLSMGGYIALAFWHRHRERLKALILSDTRATADAPDAAKGRRDMADRVQREGPAPLVDQMLSKLISPATVRDRPQVRDELSSMMMGCAPVGVAAAARGLARRKDWTDQLGEIDLPALVLCGAEDAITTPAEMQRMAAAMPDARYVEIPGVGHVPPMEAPEAFNTEVRRFLDQLG